MPKLLALGLACVALALAQDQSIGRPTYTLAPHDHILIRVPHFEKLDGRIFQVDSAGFLSLPSIGRIRAGGLTLEDLEKQLSDSLKKTSPNGPRVSITEVAYRK
ncbi:MAG: polysaccharide biosynthesis/export family protein [Bryobacteraceae bacterium]